jgi:Flp pilus assembly protein TadB
VIKEMEMDTKSASVESLLDSVRDYIETRINLLKLKAIDKSSGIMSSVVSTIFVVIIATIFIVLLNIGIALWLGDLLGKAYYGFFVVAAFYVFIGIILYSSREKWLKTPITNSIVKNLLD